MTQQQAYEWVRNTFDDDNPDRDERDEAFRAIFGRNPDESEFGLEWSLMCADTEGLCGCSTRRQHESGACIVDGKIMGTERRNQMSATYRIEHHNLDGTGSVATRVYDMPPNPRQREYKEYWEAVTDVSCPAKCDGTIRWAEAGYVPGYRICDVCGRHFLAGGTAEAPALLRVGNRRKGFYFARLTRKG